MMNSNIGAFQLRFNVRGMVCFVDDDENYLQAMMAAYRGARKALTFRIPADAGARLVADNKRLVEMEAELACIFAEENQPARIRRIYAWLMDTSRQDCIEVCFCDYAVPALDGAKLLSTIPRSRIRRVLLAAMADSQDAVLSLNAGHIDAYLPKSDPNFAKQIQTYSEHGPILQVDGIWRELVPELANLLGMPEVRASLWGHLMALDVAEHILVPTPMGFLCRTSTGKGLWVQLEIRETQVGAVEILRDEGWSQEDLLPIMSGQKTACLEVLPSLGASRCQREELAEIKVVHQAPWLGLAVFELPESVSASERKAVS
jgi:CheY-like chemotaxis protein